MSSDAVPERHGCRAFDTGFIVVVYVNHLLGAKVKGMAGVAGSIPENDRAEECETECASQTGGASMTRDSTTEIVTVIAAVDSEWNFPAGTAARSQELPRGWD
jgi:hypothetical protein